MRRIRLDSDPAAKTANRLKRRAARPREADSMSLQRRTMGRPLELAARRAPLRGRRRSPPESSARLPSRVLMKPFNALTEIGGLRRCWPSAMQGEDPHGFHALAAANLERA